MKFKKILFLGAHPDDEFGCSGSLSRFLQEGSEIFYAVFSDCEESVPEGFSKKVLIEESKKALTVLGVPESNIFRFNFPVRNFPHHRQAILEQLIVFKREIAPDLVFIPALSDIHQDHHTIAEEGVRAFKQSTLLGYELPMNTITFQHSAFVPLDESHLNKKIESLMSYRSQWHRPYVNEQFIRGMAKLRGIQMGVDWAEAFEAIRIKI